MAKGIEIMAKRKGLSTSFDSPSESARSKRTDQQNRARRKRLHTDNDMTQKVLPTQNVHSIHVIIHQQVTRKQDTVLS